jgi:hypothetical protein
MKWIFGLVVAAVSLTACAQTSTLEESPPFEVLVDGSCNSAESRLVQEHISGQIAALSKEDWESAYSYASPGFQKTVGIDQFTFIIGAQYQMLIENQGVEYGTCSISSKIFTQAVTVTSQSELFELTYSLSFEGNKLGIESASTTITQPKLNI